jgi:hypothetical protein
MKTEPKHATIVSSTLLHQKSTFSLPKRSYNFYQDASLALEMIKQNIQLTPQQCVPSLAIPESLCVIVCNIIREEVSRNNAKYLDKRVK